MIVFNSGKVSNNCTFRKLQKFSKRSVHSKKAPHLSLLGFATTLLLGYKKEYWPCISYFTKMLNLAPASVTYNSIMCSVIENFEDCTKI